MPKIAHRLTKAYPQGVTWEGRFYRLHLEKNGWRLRMRTKGLNLDYFTGSKLFGTAQRLAREWLKDNAAQPTAIRKGGGDLESLAKLYLATPKRTKQEVAEINISRLRTICRKALGRELAAVTCREVGPDLWTRYQRAALAVAGKEFSLVTRYRENIAINSAVRAARCLFLPALLRAYRAAGLSVNEDAGAATMLPVPYVPPSAVNDAELVTAWGSLQRDDLRLWLVIGLARFTGLRREEISACRAGWIVDGFVELRDRPDDSFWTKTGKPYRAQILHPEFALWLRAFAESRPAGDFIVANPEDGERDRWFERVPQRWLRKQGVKAVKPLHRLRGLYADHIQKFAQDAVTARLAGIRAAQEALGHTNPTTTETHYLSTDAIRRP
jgi:integrase